MTSEIKISRKSGGVTHKLINTMRRLPFVRRVARQWVQGHDVHILSGYAAGLRFNIAGSNPEYALGTNETEIQAVFAAHLRPGNVFYDIGANVGFFTVLAARLVGDTGQVIAFEPLPANQKALHHNLAINHFKNVTVIEAAVSRAPGQGELLVSSYSGGSALATATPPLDMISTLKVSLVSIDCLIAEKRIPPPDVVKIDVEGAELEVLEGMVHTLQNVAPVIVYEIDDNQAERFQEKERKLNEFLHAHGYMTTQIAGAYSDIDWLVGHGLAIKQADV